jgi:helix-turn-helix protein
MALYSGVSPFEMADFVGLSVDEVEEIYQHLLEIGAVDEVRTRTEVSLNAQGRNMASEAMSEQ